MVRAHWLTELGADYDTRALGTRSTREKHNPSAGIHERALEQANCNAEGDTGGAKRALVVGNGPRVLLELLEGGGELKLALLNWKQEARRWSHPLVWDAGLHWAGRRVQETEHLLHLLCIIVLGAAEDVRLGALGVSKFVDLGHGAVSNESDEGILRKQAQAHDQRLLQGLKTVILLAGIDDKEKDWWGNGGSGEAVLHGGVGR